MGGSSRSPAQPGRVKPQLEGDRPVRVQLSRAKGSRMPPNTVKVDRSTRHGNPYLVEECGAYDAVRHFRSYMCDPLWEDPYVRADQIRRRAALAALRGMNLACWCGPDDPCHADVLLDLANAPLPSPPPDPQSERASSREEP